MGAAILNKLMNVIGIGDEEVVDDCEDMEYNNEEENYGDNVEDSYIKPSFKPSRSFKDIDRESQYSGRSNIQSKVIPMNTAVSSSKMVITQPTCYEEVEGIGEYLKNKKSIIINLENVSKEDARRILDFMSGASFMVEGTIQKVSNLIYLITPKNVEIQNELEQRQYKQQQKMSFSWLK